MSVDLDFGCSSEESAAVISNGYSFVIGQLVLPVDVLMVTALIRPSSILNYCQAPVDSGGIIIDEDDSSWFHSLDI